MTDGERDVSGHERYRGVPAREAANVSDVAKQLAECLDYAHMVNEVLPVDSDADAMVARLLAERRARLPTGTRKLLPRSR
jgi:hypothetical protein